MGIIIKALFKWLLPILIVLVAATSLLSLRSCAESIGATGGGGETGEVDCAEAGVLDPDNPFTGWPVAGGVDWGRVTATFCDPIYLSEFGQTHYGFDLGYGIGVETLASAGGTVTRAEEGHALRGNNIEICHPSGYCATYMHLEDIYVTVGETVAAATPIGTVGNTGNSTGPHLHFEVHNPAGAAIDPAPSL